MPCSITPLGDTAAIVTWADESAERLLVEIHTLAEALQATRREGFEAAVPAFASLTVYYNPCHISWSSLCEWLQKCITGLNVRSDKSTGYFEIPVCYDLQFAADLPEMAMQRGMAIDEVVTLHAAADYTVQMIGFSPGFPYLAGLPELLEMARRQTPRSKVPAGSVAIGGKQTGIYTLETPGGWNIIGRTPVRLFQPQNDPPCLLQAGDRVRFVPITRDEFFRHKDSL